MYFPEIVKVVPALGRTAGSGAGAGDRVNLENYEGVCILFWQEQGAADSENVTFHKATAATGGTEDTANAIANWYYCQDVTVGTTADTWTKGTAVDSGSYLATSATNSGTSYYLIDIKAADLPEGGVNYNFVEFNTVGAGSGSNYISAVYLLYGPRYAQATLATAQS